MRFVWLSSLFFFFSAGTAQASNCGQLLGYWFGSYSYKKNEDCRRAGACTQMLTSEIKFISNSTYQVELSPPVDRYGLVKITCLNGQISLLQPTSKGEIKFSCEAQGMCHLTYEDERLIAGISRIS